MNDTEWHPISVPRLKHSVFFLKALLYCQDYIPFHHLVALPMYSIQQQTIFLSTLGNSETNLVDFRVALYDCLEVADKSNYVHTGATRSIQIDRLGRPDAAKGQRPCVHVAVDTWNDIRKNDVNDSSIIHFNLLLVLLFSFPKSFLDASTEVPEASSKGFCDLALGKSTCWSLSVSLLRIEAKTLDGAPDLAKKPGLPQINKGSEGVKWAHNLSFNVLDWDLCEISFAIHWP